MSPVTNRVTLWPAPQWAPRAHGRDGVDLFVMPEGSGTGSRKDAHSLFDEHHRALRRSDVVMVPVISKREVTPSLSVLAGPELRLSTRERIGWLATGGALGVVLAPADQRVSCVPECSILYVADGEEPSTKGDDSRRALDRGDVQTTCGVGLAFGGFPAETD